MFYVTRLIVKLSAFAFILIGNEVLLAELPNGVLQTVSFFNVMTTANALGLDLAIQLIPRGGKGNRPERRRRDGPDYCSSFA